MIVLLLGIPLLAAGLLALARGRAATIVHAVASLGTLVVGLVVTTGAVRGLDAAALGGVLRVDALSGWMIGVIVVVAALAAVEAPGYAQQGSPRVFLSLIHI